MNSNRHLRPIFDELEKLAGKNTRARFLGARRSQREQIAIDIAFRVIADHIRTLSFRGCRRHPTRNTDSQLLLRPHPAPRRSLRTHSRSMRPFFYK